MQGNTVLVIEHNLDIVKNAGWVIDLGPEGGEAVGRILAKDTVRQVADTPGSYTGKWLKKLLDTEKNWAARSTAGRSSAASPESGFKGDSPSSTVSSGSLELPGKRGRPAKAEAISRDSARGH